jgi:hypothetical protein
VVIYIVIGCRPILCVREKGMKKIALSSGSREMNDNKITRAVDKNGEKDMFSYCRLLSPCMLDRCLVLINPGLEQPAGLATGSTSNPVDNIASLHVWSGVFHFHQELFECGVRPKEYS